ncbi:CaiB/BaiF CoA transferase family protein [Salipiger bermudensis]|uniref:CaiB/BaiF CoA transferase family protein n=1 Tax=Salipiger bermudensis TaxID=344736 RepID=UPI001A8E86C9|nr:CaiB/BaiF CoA-transferase family protein [Salipiger bermudensis]MBN9675666.1 CoA transferase [Salipiger bermudensis]
MSQTRPLDGIRVLDFGAFVAGPYCGTILAALGADVVKVESPRGGDPFRRGEGAKNAYFNQMNAGKKSLAVDLKRPEGIALIKALLPGFDVLIENTRPGKMAALGLGSDAARAINPDLVYSSVSGFGDGGPWRDRAAYDTIGLSMSGFLSIMSDKDNTRLAGTCIGDLTTALVSVIGIVTGLVGRFKGTGQGGSEVKTSLLEAMTTITVDAMTQYFETGETPHRESRHPAAQSFALKTSDGQAITLHMSSSPKFFKGMLSAIERTDLLEDPRFATYDDRRAHYFELRPVVEAAFLKHDRDEWERRLIANDVPYAPVVTPDELTEHEQMQWLDMYEPPRDDGLRLLRAPMRFDGARPANHVGAPEVGQNSREVALEVLPEAEVEALIEAGVIAQAPAA